MNAKEFLESKHIEDRVLNREDLPEFWVTISQLLNEFKALSQPSVSGCNHIWGMETEVNMTARKCSCCTLYRKTGNIH